MGQVLKLFRGGLISGLILLLLLTFWINDILYQPLNLTEEKIVLEIEKGQSVRQISQLLKDKELLLHPLLFFFLYKLFF